jgi:hypothetical protein
MRPETIQGATMSSLPSQTSQKLKPLFIAVGVIALFVTLITQMPTIVRALQ